MAVVRPWVTPEDIRAYTDKKQVAERDEAKLKTDIFRAEQKVMAITHNRFEDPALESVPDPVRIAVIIIAEAYANNSIEQSAKQKKSETFDDYSYTLESGIIDIDSLDLDYLLKDFVLDQSKGSMKLRISAI